MAALLPLQQYWSYLVNGYQFVGMAGRTYVGVTVALDVGRVYASEARLTRGKAAALACTSVESETRDTAWVTHVDRSGDLGLGCS
jgi:hypothetical protein